MLKRFIIGAAVAVAFSSNAFALTGQGKFKAKSQKINGAWALVEHDNKQVLAFHKKFDAKTDSKIKLVLSKQKVRKIENSPAFVEPLTLGSIRSNKGDQNFVVPASVKLKEYKSLVLFDEAQNVVIAGFDIPRERSSRDNRNDFGQYDRDIGGGGGGGS